MTEWSYRKRGKGTRRLELTMFDWFWKMGNSKEERRFEILDGRLIDIQDRLRKFDRKVEKIMSEFTDALQSVKDDVTRIGDDVKAVLEKLQQPNPDVVAATEALKQVDAGLDAAAVAMEAAINPPATGTPPTP